MSYSDCLIVGASHAAAQLAPRLRQLGWQHSIRIIGEELIPPYHRPPLSKEYLSGKKSIEDLLIRPSALYEQLNIQLKLGVRVESVSASEHSITLCNGDKLHYNKLVLATGSSVRRLSVPGADLAGLFYIRSIVDVEKIRPYVQKGKKAVVIGAGYIGLEAAAMLTQLGMNVTILESAERILERVTSNTVSDFLHRLHQQHGVEILTNVQVEALEGDAHVSKVRLADGSRLPADLVIAGIGVTPATQLAESAGLMLDNGIKVDAYTQTSSPDILAVGDCTTHFSELYQRWVRLESVQNASDQANACAQYLCGKPQAYSALPWFWSDQYGIKLQIAGLAQGYDRKIVRQNPGDQNALTVFYLQGDKLLALDAINQPKDFMQGKRLISDQTNVDSTQLADPYFALSNFFKQS